MNTQQSVGGISFSFSERALHHPVKLPFGCAIIRGTSASAAKESIDRAKTNAMQELLSNEKQIATNLEAFGRFFEAAGYKNPLSHQFKTTLRKGFPTINPFVEGLLVCEMCEGVLMGVQDLDQIRDCLVFDAAASAESFEGMRARIQCKEGEFVVRDAEGIIASYYQGPDRRTGIRPDTHNVVFYAFGAPGIDATVLAGAVKRATSLFEGICASAECQVFEPK